MNPIRKIAIFLGLSLCVGPAFGETIRVNAQNIKSLLFVGGSMRLVCYGERAGTLSTRRLRLGSRIKLIDLSKSVRKREKQAATFRKVLKRKPSLRKVYARRIRILTKEISQLRNAFVVCRGRHVCGDGRLEQGESCDDGNISNGDGCAGSCRTEQGWGCVGQPSSCTPSFAVVNVSLSPSRTSGVAPLAVFFDATDTTASATAAPFRELDYTWDFGDPAAGTWASNDTPRNTAKNGVAAHVFDPVFSPGEAQRSFTVTLTVKDAEGVTSFAQTVINVQNPDSFFSGVKTRCVSASGNFEGCPAGSQQVTSSDFSAQMAWVNEQAARRLLFHRGESWQVSATGSIEADGPSLIGAYGECLNPNSRGLCQNAPLLSTTSAALSVFGFDMHHDRPDWRIMQLSMEGQSCDACGTGIGGLNGLKQELIYRVKVRGFRVGIGNSRWDDFDDELAIVDSEVSEAFINQVFVGSSRLMLLGNHFHDSSESHVLRVWEAHKGVISENLLERASALHPEMGRHALKLHGPSANLSTPPSEFIAVSGNTFVASGPWPVGVGPQNAGEDERLREIVIERNYFNSATTSQQTVQVSLELWCRQTTVRNNIFDGTGNWGSGYTAIEVTQRGIEPAPQDIFIYNNTAYHGEAKNDFIFTRVDAMVQGAVIANNLVSAPLAVNKSIVVNHSESTVSHHNLSVADAGFRDPAHSDFILLSSSPAIDGGADVPLQTDASGTARPVDGDGNGNAAWDLGAFEYSADPRK